MVVVTVVPGAVVAAVPAVPPPVVDTGHGARLDVDGTGLLGPVQQPLTPAEVDTRLASTDTDACVGGRPVADVRSED